MSLNLPYSSIQDIASGQWLALQQHYELPTRLLDWSKNHLIALYFACNENPDEDGSVYMLNPYKLYQVVHPIMKAISSSQGHETIPYFNFPWSRYEIFVMDDFKSIVVPISPLVANEREKVQEGVFTVSNDLSIPQDEIFQKNLESDDYFKIKIDKECKFEIAQHLVSRYGFSNEFLMYPIRDVANQVKNSYSN